MEENSALYRYTNLLKITSVTDETEPVNATKTLILCDVRYSDFIGDFFEKIGLPVQGRVFFRLRLLSTSGCGR